MQQVGSSGVCKVRRVKSEQLLPFAVIAVLTIIGASTEENNVFQFFA